MRYWTYIIKSEVDNRYYVGQTQDLVKRIAKHNAGTEKSTSKYRPWILVYSEVFDTRSQAFAREQEIKGWKKRAKIEQLISDSNL